MGCQVCIQPGCIWNSSIQRRFWAWWRQSLDSWIWYCHIQPVYDWISFIRYSHCINLIQMIGELINEIQHGAHRNSVFSVRISASRLTTWSFAIHTRRIWLRLERPWLMPIVLIDLWFWTTLCKRRQNTLLTIANHSILSFLISLSSFMTSSMEWPSCDWFLSFSSKGLYETYLETCCCTAVIIWVVVIRALKNCFACKAHP